MKKFLLASFAGLALAQAPAQAADLPYKAPPPPPVYNWTGCYADAGVGYGIWNQDHYLETYPAPMIPLAAETTNGGRG